MEEQILETISSNDELKLMSYPDKAWGCCGCRRLEQDLQDRNRQVATLLREVTALKQGSALGGRAPSAANPGALVTAADVVSDRLVAFRDIEVRSWPHA